LLALASPIAEISDIRRFPTTINIFGIPDEDFVYCFARMMKNFGWTGANQVCGLEGDYRFLGGFCQNSIAPLVQQILPNFPVFQLYHLDAGVIRDSEVDGVLTQIANKRGTYPAQRD
jgi:hypothetical protein